MTKLAQAAVLGLTVVALSCDKGPPPTETPETTPPATGEEAPPAEPETGDADVAWADMDMDQKKHHMMTVVQPAMEPVFTGFDAERYKEFNCAVCHGPGAAKGEFAMPSPSLPKLPPNGDFAKIMEAKPEVMKWMGGEVVPKMAESLGIAPYNPETHEGFGCYGCHQTQ